MTLRASLFLLLALVVPARANLGETVEGCVTRYGKPVGYSEANAKSPFGTVAFMAGGYTLLVFVVKDKEVGARVSKTDKSAFTTGEIQTIMSADAAPGPWVPDREHTDATQQQWTRADHATVIYDIAKHVLIFTSDEMARALHT
jgi:hypothetical protein